MADLQKSKAGENVPSHPPSEMGSSIGSDAGGKPSKYPNPPEASIPDAATLRDQWRFAIRQYSKWYSHAWGTAILAGASFFALGWIIKGSNPLPSLHQSSPHDAPPTDSNPSSANPNRT